MGVAFGGFLCPDPQTLWENARQQTPPLPLSPWYGKVNSFYCPLGTDPGRAYLLMLQSDLNSLDLTKLYDLAFSSQSNLDAAPSTVTLKNLLVVKATCITPGASANLANCYFVELADRRALYHRTTIDKAYNLRDANGNYLTATENSGTPWTWSQMVSDIWNAVGTANLGTAPSLPFTPDGTPEGFQYYGMSALDALNDVLKRLACALQYNPFLDTFNIVRIGVADANESAAETKWDNALRRIWDIYSQDPAQASVPTKVNVEFRKVPAPSDGTSLVYTLTYTDPSPAAGANGTVTISDDLYALMPGPSNGTLLTNRTNERGADYLRCVKAWTRLDKVYGNILNEPGFVPGSMLKYLAYEDRGLGLKTEIGRAPATIEIQWPTPAANLVPTAGTNAGEIDPLTTKGDIEVFSTKVDRQPVGGNSQFLTADSTQATGLKWKTLTLFGDRYVIGLSTSDGNALANVATPFALTELTGQGVSTAIVDTTNGTWTQDASGRPKSPSSGTRDVFVTVTLRIGRGTDTAGTIYLLVLQAATTNFPASLATTNTSLLGMTTLTSAELPGNGPDVFVTASGWMTVAASTVLFVYTCLTGAAAAVTILHVYPLMIQDQPFLTLA